MISRSQLKGILGLALLLSVALVACHKEEQEVAKVANGAVTAEHKAQAAATEIDRQRAALANIPLPTKSLYVDVHEPGAWANPFLSVDAEMLTLRVTMADANPSALGQGTMLRPGDLTEALIALPPGAWRYGRVIAVAESPLASRKDQPKVRRNIEAVIQRLNDLGIVVEEWPAR